MENVEEGTEQGTVLYYHSIDDVSLAAAARAGFASERAGGEFYRPVAVVVLEESLRVVDEEIWMFRTCGTTQQLLSTCVCGERKVEAEVGEHGNGNGREM